jgi:hypothetical protein
MNGSSEKTENGTYYSVNISFVTVSQYTQSMFWSTWIESEMHTYRTSIRIINTKIVFYIPLKGKIRN